MRVLHIGAVCGHGGTETVMATLIKEQRNHGIEADAFFFSDLGGATHFVDICCVRFANSSSLTELLLNHEYDLLHVISGAAPNARLCAKRSSFQGAIVETCHGTFHEWSDSHCITAVSQHTANAIQGRCEKLIQIIPNGIDTNRFSIGQRLKLDNPRPLIAWIGRYVDYLKDFDGFIALANSSAMANFAFEVVDGSMIEYDFQHWLPSQAMVTRKKSWSEMPDFYRGIRDSGGLVVSTSRSESFGLSLIEAGSCGCPVAAPQVGGIAEVIEHKKTGYLYDRSGGTEALIEAINWIRADSNYDSISKNASAHVQEKYTSNRMFESYCHVYEQALDLNKGSRHFLFSRALPIVKRSFLKSAQLIGFYKRKECPK